MKKFIRRVVKTFKKLADSNFLTFGQTVTASMAGASGIFTTPTPPLADINAELVIYGNLLQTSSSRDKVQVELKNKSKFSLMVMLSQLADYVNLTTTDASQLVQSGFDLNKLPQPISLKAPSRLVLTDGGNSGEMNLKFKGVNGASSYLFQYTSDTLLAENSWVTIPSTTTSYTFSGLTKGTTYHCRAVAVGANQQIMKSNIINRISQ